MNVSTDDSNITTGSLQENDELQKMIDDDVPFNKSISSEIERTNERTTGRNNAHGQSSVSISYWKLLNDFPMYRYCLLSYIVTQLGEWLTYVASLSILELAASSVANEANLQHHLDDDLFAMASLLPTIAPEVLPPLSSSSAPGSGLKQQHHLLISMLVVCRLIPTTISSFFGGILADTCDRKNIMLRLDIIGGCVAILYYVMAINMFHNNEKDDKDQSSFATTVVSTTTVVILLLCTVAQSAISGLYQPSRTSIVPMLVGEGNNDNIEKANEIATVVWSISAAIGSSLGGFIVDQYGFAICFATDTILYFTSAIILAIFVKGNYNVLISSTVATKASLSTTNSTITITDTEHDTHNKKNVTIPSRSTDQTQKKHMSRCDGSSHSNSSLRGLIRDVRIFITTHDSAPFLLIKGCGALLFGASDVINVTFSQNPETGVLDPQRLGYMFTAIGIGCLFGPIAMPPRRCYLSACIGSYYIIALGYAGMAWSRGFWWKCFWTGLRASGTAVLWVDSSILLQTTTPATLLGRISSIDLAIALLAEAASAMFAGVGQDNGMTVQQISIFLSGMGLLWGTLWTIATIYHRKQIQHHKRTSRKSERFSLELEPLHNN